MKHAFLFTLVSAFVLTVYLLTTPVAVSEEELKWDVLTTLYPNSNSASAHRADARNPSDIRILGSVEGPQIGITQPICQVDRAVASLQPSTSQKMPRSAFQKGYSSEAFQANLDLPDLNVAYIMQLPRYDYSAAKNTHAPGDQMQFVGHIANRGHLSSGPFDFVWNIDDQPVFSSTHPGLAPQEMITLPLNWTWQSGIHTIKLELDPVNEIAEVSELNNSVEDRTNALAVGFWVEQSVYDWFNAHQVELELGSVSWDDWAQRQLKLWNEIFANAVTPLTPQGVLDRVRLDKVVIVPDGNLPSCATNIYEIHDETTDLQWGFPSEMVGVPSGHTCGILNEVFINPGLLNVTTALLHELSHARYLIDLYGLNVFTNAAYLSTAVSSTSSTLPVDRDIEHNDTFPTIFGPVYLSVGGELIACTSKLGNTFAECSRGVEGTIPRSHQVGEPVNLATVRLQDGSGNLVQGSPKLPLIGAYSDHLYFNPYPNDLMSDYGSPKYEQHSAYALNRIAGKRPICGNYNAPCNIGEYLNDIPHNNIVEIRTLNGLPVQGAQIEVYQASPALGLWYGRYFDNTPDIVVLTDAQGRANIGSFPFSSDNQIVHTWGFSNGIILLKIVSDGQSFYKFLNVTQANEAFWSGNEEQATYTFELDITQIGCPILPGNIVQNPCFEAGETPWEFYSNGWGGFDTATPGYDGAFAARVEINSVASNIQLFQHDLPLEPNQKYKLYFAAKSSGSEKVRLLLHKHGSPYTNYGLDKEFSLTTGWPSEPYEFEFTTNSLAMADGRLRFWLAPYAEAGTVYWFDNVYLVKITDDVPPPPDPNPLEVAVPPLGHCNPPVAGNILDNPGFEASEIAPWRFYTNGRGYALPNSSTAYECVQSAKVTIQQEGSNVQLFQYGLDLQPNTSYQLRLAAKASDGRDVRLYLQKHSAPYTNYGLNGLPLDLTSEWQVFVVQFTTTGFSTPVSDGRLRIWLAGTDAANAQYYFDDVVLVPLDEILTAGTMSESLGDLQSFSLLDSQAGDSSVTTGQLLISGFFIDDDDAGRAQGAFLPLQRGAEQCAKAQPSHAALWPADGRMVKVKIVGAGKPTSLFVTGIWQDEDIGAEVDGVLNGDAALLRAERADNGNGRVYHVAFNATYRDGTICGHDVLVTVPIERGAHGVRDDGPLANSTQLP